MTRPMSELAPPQRRSETDHAVRQLQRRPAPTLVARIIIHVKVFSDVSELIAGDAAFIFACSEDMDGMDLVDVEAYVTTVSTSGKPTVQIRNISQTADMLSTRVEIDANEFHSKDAATQAVIDTANDDVLFGDRIALDIDVAGTGAKGLGVVLSFA